MQTPPSPPSPPSSVSPPSPVLVTGCSSGIGRATALRLARAGHTVYATARRPETLQELREHRCHPLRLDVTDEASMRDAVTAVEAAHGRVGTLVNNAGYAEIGPVEHLTPDRLRRQFETNVIGALRLSQLVLPGMRSAGAGRIINVGSIGGRCVFPLWGGYTASKHALTALTETLRMEVARHGVRVVLVEPGLTRTNFATAIDHNITRYATGPASTETTDAPYDAPLEGFRALVRGVLGDTTGAAPARLRAGMLRRILKEPDAVVAAIAHAATVRRPRARYLVPAHARFAVAARRLLPASLWNALVSAVFLGRQRPPDPAGGPGGPAVTPADPSP